MLRRVSERVLLVDRILEVGRHVLRELLEQRVHPVEHRLLRTLEGAQDGLLHSLERLFADLGVDLRRELLVRHGGGG